MDLRSLCSKIDVDAIRAKIPPLPNMVTHIKLPKSMSKLKSRKIFRSSREDVNSIGSKRSASKRLPSIKENLAPPPLAPPSEFINRTPTRISTISSLMNQSAPSKTKSRKDDDEYSYRSAGGIDDYYPSPLSQRFEERLSRPISPVRAPSVLQNYEAQSEQNIKMSFSERVQKGYRDVSSFRLKHIFAKKTVVRKDNIEVDHYVNRYNEELKRDERIQEKRDRQIADNYRFQFKISKQNSDESYGNSPIDSPVNKETKKKFNIDSPIDSPVNLGAKKVTPKSLSELSGDESGMESSPPKRKPGIASTRFSRVRKTPLNMSLEEDDDNEIRDEANENFEFDEEAAETPKSKTKPHTSSINDLRKQKSIERTEELSRVRKTPQNMSFDEDEDNDDINKNKRDELNESFEFDEDEEPAESPKSKPNKSSLYELRQQKSSERTNIPNKSPQKSKSFKERISRLTKQRSESEETVKAPEKKRKAPLSPQQSEEQDAVSTPTHAEKRFDAIKQNFKRLQKSMKLPQHTPAQSGAESENDDPNQEAKPKLTKTQQITERLKRFRSVDNVNKNQEEDENKIQDSPMRKIAEKLQEWKMKIKNKSNETHTSGYDNDDEPTSPQKQDKPVGALMKKLKHIRSRKHESTDDPDDDEEGGSTYKESLGARAKIQFEKSKAAARIVPQRTMKKISETKKYFRKKQDNEGKNKSDKANSDEDDGEDEPKKTKVKEQPQARLAITRPPPPIPRPYIRDSSEEDDEDDEEDDFPKNITMESKQIVPIKAKTAWATKPFLSDDTTDYDDELPRVLIHQDNSDVFESTLIIAVTRPRSYVNSPIITELPPDSPVQSTPDTKPDNWVPSNQQIDSTPSSPRKLYNATTISRFHSRKQSIDSSSDDSWIKDVPRDVSTAALNRLYENEEPWKIQPGTEDEKLFKAKSIDIFEFQKKNGKALTPFADFDDQLKHAPVVKIQESHLVEIHLNTASFERESSEDLDYPDDDNSSRVTKIAMPPCDTKKDYSGDDNSARVTKIAMTPSDTKKEEERKENLEPELKSKPYGNSRESLMGDLDDNDVAASGEEEEDNEDSNDDGDEYDEDDEDDDDEDDEEEEHNLPPSKAPSPPPSVSPTPPPLPQRQPSIRLSKLHQTSLEKTCPPTPPPPLPQTKPPIPPNRPIAPPPKIPERTASMSKIAKPLVKTESLRLAYSEQLNPQDVGKVNKLISRFEHDGGQKQRPRIIPRKPYMTSESEEDSDNEDEVKSKVIELRQKEKLRDITPTNKPRMQKSFSIDSADMPINNNNNNINLTSEEKITLARKATSQIILDNSTSTMSIPSISISSSCQDVNSNFSQPSSEYGSPLAYPSSLVGSTEVTPLTNRRDSDLLGTRRSRRSMQRDDENFYSFDSDEENSYYSISSTSSNRYVVEL